MRLHYSDRGEGSPVVLIHGNAVTGDDWDTSGVAEQLMRSHRVIIFDRPGFGYSERPRGHLWTAAQQAELLHTALRQLGVERPVVAGHSWGTLVALALAERHQADVAGLVLLSGYYFWTLRPDALMVVPGALPVLARLSQLGPDLRNFALPWCRKSSEHRGASRCEPAKTGCGADQPPCETASRFGRLAPCFYATSCAARTARSTAIGALSRTAGYPAGGRCSDTCFIWARSTTASAPHGVRRSRRSTRTGRAANRSHCSPRIVRRRHWIAMWCMSGSAVCAYAGRGNGVAAGWRAICGISFNWMSSGHHVCRYRDRGHAG